MALLYINRIVLNRQAFSDKVESISAKLGIDPNWLMFLMDFESEISSSRENSFGCIGLIQFCPDFSGGSYKTIGGIKYNMADIKNMSNVDQLDLVYEYLKPYKGDMQQYYDLYFAILFPVALGKEDTYVLNTKSNPIFDLNKDGSITVAEVKQFLDNRLNEKVPVSYHDTFKKKTLFCKSIEGNFYSGRGL